MTCLRLVDNHSQITAAHFNPTDWLGRWTDAGGGLVAATDVANISDAQPARTSKALAALQRMFSTDQRHEHIRRYAELLEANAKIIVGQDVQKPKSAPVNAGPYAGAGAKVAGFRLAVCRKPCPPFNIEQKEYLIVYPSRSHKGSSLGPASASAVMPPAPPCNKPDTAPANTRPAAPQSRGSEQMSERKNNGQWNQGVSGNPKGCATGSRNRVTLAAQNVLDADAEAISRKALDMAMQGDVQALRLVMERLLPARKDRPLTLALPKIESTADLVTVVNLIAQAVGNGEITPAEGAVLSQMVEIQRRTLHTGDLETRLAALEAAKEIGR